MNIIQYYNLNMGSVDLAYKLQGNYCIYIGVHNRKWWLSIMFFNIGVMLTNEYIMYVKVNESNRV